MTLEPRATAPERRLAAVRTLSDAGVPTYVNMAPVIPAITDSEVETIVAHSLTRQGLIERPRRLAVAA